jgi:exopolysaccharide biosynthesis polyprenyl glycosylphosphotransferase
VKSTRASVQGSRVVLRDEEPRTQCSTSLSMERGSRFLRYLLVGLDGVALMVSWIVATVVIPRSSGSVGVSAVAGAVFVAGGLVVFGGLGLYRARVCSLRAVECEHVAKGCIVIGLGGIVIQLTVTHRVRTTEIVLASVIALVFVLVLRSGYRTWVTNQRRDGRYLRSVVLVGTGSEGATIAQLLKDHPELGYKIVGVLGDQVDAERHGFNGSWRGELEDGLAVLVGEKGVGAIVCAGDLRSTQLNKTVQTLLKAGVRVQMSSGLQGVDVGRLRPSPLAHEPFFYIEHVVLASWQLAAKRAIDIAIAAPMLIMALPVVAAAALGIKLQDPGPVFFKQSRIGRDGAPFTLFKLRTMRQGAETEPADLLGLNVRDGPLTKFSRDPRVTVLGRILRATSIDELPQLWNVLQGTMSLVGPRPALADEVARFDVELRERHSVRPGITGLWQVEGRDSPSFAVYRRFDIFYVQNWSVTLDLMILLGTVEAVIARALRALPRLDEDLQLSPVLEAPEPPEPVVARLVPIAGKKESVRRSRSDARAQDSIAQRVAQ